MSKKVQKMALTTLALALLCAAAAPFHAASGAVTLNVAHVNDIHAHFEEVLLKRNLTLF